MRRIGLSGCSLRLPVGPSRRTSPARLFFAIAGIGVECGKGQLTALPARPLAIAAQLEPLRRMAGMSA